MSNRINNDLFQLVKTSKLSTQTKFWGAYEFLNNTPEASVPESVLLRYQLSKLKALESSNPGLIKANEILNKMNQVQPMSIQNEIIELSTNQIYARILEILNSAFISSPTSIKGKHLEKKEGNTRYTYKEGSSKQTFQQDQDQTINELDILLEMIKYPERASLIANVAKGLNGNSIAKSTGFSSYQQYKADQAEKLMMHALGGSSEGWQALVSGSFFHKGQQLIEDGFIFADTDMSLTFDQNFQVTVRNKKNSKSSEKSVSSLQEFFNLVNSLNKTETISLSDELYSKLQELSILKAQSKSGFGVQELINKTAHRGAISLNATGVTASIQSLWNLYEKGWIDSGKESNSLAHIANYCLSKSIALTSLLKNDIYFTRDGFISASQWMQMYSYMLKFNPAISKISNNFLSNENPYVLEHVG